MHTHRGTCLMTLEERELRERFWLKGLLTFASYYQVWCSEAKALIRQLLPDRIEDFVLEQFLSI